MSDLEDLGLSGYEAAAYRALLQLGRAPASDVAETGTVPQGRVYDVLNGLAARDPVRVHRGSDPRRYAAVDPETAVDRLLAERERELVAERERYADLADSVRSGAHPPEDSLRSSSEPSFVSLTKTSHGTVFSHCPEPRHRPELPGAHRTTT